MKKLIEEFLSSIGEDPAREGLQKTPERWTEAMKDLTSGYEQDADSIINGALFTAESSGIVTVEDIEFYSLCEHHVLPFFGTVSVSYVPGEHIIGLSKIPRIVDMFSMRLQTQERLTEQIAETLFQALSPLSLEVTVEAEHLCMMMRGVKKERSRAITTVQKGDV